MDEEGNQGYYLYDEATGEEKLFSIVEEEQREFARGVGMAVQNATQFAQSKGQSAFNKAAKRSFELNNNMRNPNIIRNTMKPSKLEKIDKYNPSSRIQPGNRYASQQADAVAISGFRTARKGKYDDYKYGTKNVMDSINNRGKAASENYPFKKNQLTSYRY